MKLSCCAGGLKLVFSGLVGAFVLLAGGAASNAGEYLIGDRIGGRVLRYAENGTFIDVVLTDPSLGIGNAMGGLSAVALSPDQTKLYVADRIGQRVAVYDYDGFSTSFAFNIFANGASTIEVPAGILFSQDGSEVYVSSIGFTAMSDKVAQLTPAGASAGADFSGGPTTGRSGMAFDPMGRLLVTSFGFGANGGVLRFNSGTNMFETLVTPVPELGGAASLLVVGDDLYVTAGTGGRLGKFDVDTGALDMSFGTGGYVSGLAFPASLALGPDGDSLLVGTLGGGFPGDPTNRIDEYDFDGNLLGTWANNTFAANFPGGMPGDTWFGFSEPTAIVHSTIIPEPAVLTLGLIGMGVIGLVARSRRA
jgi:DNA-binding beta-propeller fold protein YncE